MIVLFDLNHVSYRCLFAAKKDIQDVGWQYFKNIMYNTVIATSKRFEATEIFLCVDSKENWRKKIFPEYKEARREKRDKIEDVDWNAFFNAFNEFIIDTKKYFPFYVIQQKYLEADDIIGIIAKEWQDKKKIVITSDQDYVQLLKYNNIEIFDPVKAKFMKTDDPRLQLKTKIIMGDRGDNIPAIQPRIGKVTAKKIAKDSKILKEMFEDKTVSYKTEDGKEVTLGEECQMKYKLNTKLIDLDRTPDVLVNALKKQVVDYELPSGKEIFQYLTENKYRELLRKMDDIENIVKVIVENKNKKTFNIYENVI